MLALVMSDGTALSWGEVFDEYAPALTCYARSRGVREPEDLVQDVFVAAFRQLPGFAGDRSGLRSLLFTIAYRRIADHHRRGYRRPETLVAEHSPRPDPGPTVEQIVDLGEAAGRAMEAFGVLSERERRVLEMRILEEDTPASVGRALGLSSGNVRVIQARALAKVRKHLRSTGDGGFALPMVAFGALTDSFRYLRTKLPADDLLGPWIAELRTASPSTLEATTTASRIAVTSGSVAATGRATDASYSLVSSVISSGAARLGAAVSAVALSTVPLLPALFPGAESPPLSEETTPVVEIRDAEPTAALQVQGATSVGADEKPVDLAATGAPTPVGSVAIEAPQPAGPVLDDAIRSAGPVAPGLEVEVPDASTPEVVGNLVEPLVAETVDALSGDVVEPLVEVVEDTVETATEAVPPLVDEAVQRLPDGLTDTIDDLVPGLGGLPGGG
jgi:RNA polymerase sigma-70 factor (ECF subfamily)